MAKPRLYDVCYERLKGAYRVHLCHNSIGLQTFLFHVIL